ncbi:MAG: hypothetical protein J6N72_05080 [Psychrobacter sp.]|nr:hypothetical protein [Psychrobacter sp.]
MIEEKQRLTPLTGKAEDHAEPYYLSTQGQMAIKSWFKVSSSTKCLAWGYAVMLVAMVLFAIASKGVNEAWFWQKVVFLIIASAVLIFISSILRMMIYSGRPIAALKHDLLDVYDEEKIVTANNFYSMISKILLIPTITIALAVISTQSRILDFTTLKGEASLGSITGLIFVVALIINSVILIKLYIFLMKARKGNKSLEEKIEKRHSEIQA